MTDRSVITVDKDIEDVADALLKQAAAETSIEVNNVTVSFKTPKGVYTAVKDINLTVQKG